ncbi:MAG: heparinase II/III family protein [Acidiferrobacterales bacterium]|nr:heparinase II/III family protein [Acidiferrobacterales bacterium]
MFQLTKKYRKRIFLIAVVASFATYSIVASAKHPKLILTHSDVPLIRDGMQGTPTFNAAFNQMRDALELTMAKSIDVPVPADAGGGYTHEQHKRNNTTIYQAGLSYQLTGERKYLEHARELLLAYAKLYPTLGEHPKKKEQSPGRLFWQSLNEAVWLVYVAQGYDAIIDDLSQEDREAIESGVLRPMAKFLSEESPQTFNKIHNHGTWAVAAVGMTGYVLGEDDWVEKSLTGLDKSGNYGFLKQIDKLFSPDGYYTEGPYYQRYALMPFVLFAKAIDNNDPKRKIFEYRNGLLPKAIYAAIQLSYNKLFFPINDAIKDKSIETTELVHGVSIAYGLSGDASLLDIAQQQGRVSISGDGFKLAKAIDADQVKGFPFKSMSFADGADGKQGALTVLRSDSEPGHQALVFKSTSQGLGHGHFDRLSWLYYDNKNEIVSDYGAARFLNIEAKYGGHYLPENNAYAKQSIAHNSLVVDETSHFEGEWREGQKYAPKIHFVELSDTHEITSATSEHAYKDLSFTRTMGMVKHASLERPLVIDLLRVESKVEHQYDLPIHFHGHITNVSRPTKAFTDQRVPLGSTSGYQFLWKEAIAEIQGVKEATTQPVNLTWIKDDRFYTAHHAASNFAPNSELIFTRVGANDPDFNLRAEQGVIQRVRAASHTFASVLETHGEYNPILEYTNDSNSAIQQVSLLQKKSADMLIVQLKNDQRFAVLISKKGAGKHTLSVGGQTFQWSGWATVADIN